MDQIKQVLETCSLLESIAIDVKQSTDGSSEVLIMSNLTRFKHLRDIRLNIDLGLDRVIEQGMAVFGGVIDWPLKSYLLTPFAQAQELTGESL